VTERETLLAEIAEALEAMREAREALEYCEVEAYRFGYGRIETNAREALTRLTAAIAKIEGQQP
jgi:hypothetical protein